MTRAAAGLVFAWLAMAPGPARASGGWEVVGVSGFSPGPVICCQVAVDAQGVVHVAYQDQSLGSNPASVQRFSGGAWSFVGQPGTASLAQAWYNRFAFQPDGGIVLACRDYGVGGRANVRRFHPGMQAWIGYGAWGPSAGEAHYVDLAMAPDGTSSLVYADRTTTPPDRATVLRWNGASWSVLGSPGVSAAAADFASIAVAAAGTTYVAWSDASLGGKACAARWDEASSSWQPLGAPAFSPSTASNLRLAVDRAGAPWVAYHEYHAQIVVMRFDGSQWIQVGGSASGSDRPAVETEGWRQWLSLAFDSQGAPYVAYQRYDDQRRAAVRRFDGSQWNPVGSPGFSPPEADYLALAIGPEDVPYVVFRDSSAGLRATVMRFAPSPHVFCEAVPDSLGCSPSISAVGAPGTAAGGAFLVSAGPTASQRNGMLVYSSRPDHVPFGGGYLCLSAPFKRTSLQGSGGTPGGGDCTGAYSFDFDALIQNGADPELVPGSMIFAQYLYRDPAGVGGVAVSGALRFEIGL